MANEQSAVCITLGTNSTMARIKNLSNHFNVIAETSARLSLSLSKLIVINTKEYFIECPVFSINLAICNIEESA